MQQSLQELFKYLISLRSGPAYESFKQSIINDFLMAGYSDERARQVVDELELAFRSKLGFLDE